MKFGFGFGLTTQRRPPGPLVLAIGAVTLSEGVIGFTLNKTAHVYYLVSVSATQMTGAAIKAAVIATTPLIYGDYVAPSGETDDAISLAALADGDYYLHVGADDGTTLVAAAPFAFSYAADVSGTPPTFKAAGAQTSATSNTTVAWPAGHAINDVAVLPVHIQGAIGAGYRHADLVAAGWAQKANVSGTRREILYWKRATSTSEAAAPINEDGTDGFTRAFGRIVTFKDCVTTGDPIALIGSQTQAASLSVNFVDGTTSGANRGVAGFMACVIDLDGSQLLTGFTNAALAGLANIITDNSSSGAGFGLYAFAGTKAAAGAVGNTTGTISASVESQQILIELIGA